MVVSFIIFDSIVVDKYIHLVLDIYNETSLLKFPFKWDLEFQPPHILTGPPCPFRKMTLESFLKTTTRLAHIKSDSFLFSTDCKWRVDSWQRVISYKTGIFPEDGTLLRRSFIWLVNRISDECVLSHYSQ